MDGRVTRVHVERTIFSEIPVIKCEIHTNFHNNQLNDSAFEISVKQPPTDASERVLCPLSSRYAAQRTSGSARRAMNRKNARRSATRHAARWRSIRGLGQSIAASHTLVTALDSEWLHVYMLYVYLEIVVEVSDDECCITKCMYPYSSQQREAYIRPLLAQASSEQEGWAIVPHAAQCGLGTSHAPLNRFAGLCSFLTMFSFTQLVMSSYLHTKFLPNLSIRFSVKV
ncbi:hypothetical protein MSG28_000135 [Choristoneura fumiferana]|uniref:Uncharacterized protein n=1 Tax=Choristoneura fumiferana TaxID=7141 RepID=A0ACC0JZY1_CHOFU|nr:hypothetical protein MSG28_000135 [Choristoneura fumiferana]